MSIKMKSLWCHCSHHKEAGINVWNQQCCSEQAVWNPERERERERTHLHTRALGTWIECNFSEKWHWAYLYISMNNVVVVAVPQSFKDLSHVVTRKKAREKKKRNRAVKVTVYNGFPPECKTVQSYRIVAVTEPGGLISPSGLVVWCNL